MVLIAPTAGVDVASKRTLMEAVTVGGGHRPRGAGGHRRDRRPALLRPGPGHVPRPDHRRIPPWFRRQSADRGDGRARLMTTRRPRRRPSRPGDPTRRLEVGAVQGLRPGAADHPGAGLRRDLRHAEVRPLGQHLLLARPGQHRRDHGDRRDHGADQRKDGPVAGVDLRLAPAVGVFVTVGVTNLGRPAAGRRTGSRSRCACGRRGRSAC